LAAAGAACLHSAAQTSGSGPAGPGLQTVVVTAQKRIEPLQDVPIPVTAFDAGQLEKLGTADFRDLATRTPGFTMTQFNVGEPQYSIRGVGSSSDSAAGDATVAVFVDEVFIGRPAGANFGFLDLERVEVLRGPQGTLFGRNTSGGAISVTTARPRLTPSAKVSLSLGNYNAVDAGAVINRPLGASAAVKLSVGYRDRDGFSRHIRTGASLDGGKNTSARLQLMLNPSSATTLLLSADGASDRADGLARVPFPVFANTGTAPLIRQLYPEGTDLRRAYSDPASFQNRDVHGLSVRLEHDMSLATLTSITAYRKTRLNQLEDLSVLPQPPWVLKNLDRVKENARQWSQEVRLGSRGEGGLRWVAGLFAFREKVVRDESFDTAFTLLPAAGGNVLFNQDVKNESMAVFGQIDFALASRMNVSVGLRQTRDKKTADQAAINLAPNDPTPGIPLFPGQPYDILASKSWSATTGKLGLDWKLDRDKMVYASISRGYKSGLFPSQNNSVQSVATPLEPEKVWNAELGMKSEWLDRRLRVNASAFKLDYKDLQQFNLTPQLVLVSFSIDARIEGAEVEFQAAPLPWLQFGGSVAYLDTVVTNGVFAGFNLNGNRLARAPRNSTTAFVDVSSALAGGRVNARLEYAHKERFYTDAANSPTNLIPGYATVDARIAWRPAAIKGLELALWGKNLTDKLYQQHVIGFLGNGFSTFAPPRTVGASLLWNL
jgi:iron complex outermembrane receptor protein